MGRDSSLVCHCHSQTHSHKPASQHSSGLSSIHTGLSAPNSSLRRRCSPQSAHLPAVGRLAAAASLKAGDYPWGKSSLNYRILEITVPTAHQAVVWLGVCSHKHHADVAEVCAASARHNTTHFGGFSLNGIITLSEILINSVEIYEIIRQTQRVSRQ